MIRALDKRRSEYRHVGWLYIMRSPAFREPLLKIGKSRRPPPLRAEELGTATAIPYNIVRAEDVDAGLVKRFGANGTVAGQSKPSTQESPAVS